MEHRLHQHQLGNRLCSGAHKARIDVRYNKENSSWTPGKNSLTISMVSMGTGPQKEGNLLPRRFFFFFCSSLEQPGLALRVALL